MQADKLNLRRSLTVLLTLSALLVVPLASTSAQQQPEGGGQALEISPTLATLDLNPGESTTLEVQLRNVSNDVLLVGGDINDFVASNESGAPKVIIDEEDIEELGDNPFSFRDWVEPLPEVLLEPNDIETLTITINVPEDASPGGHYGAIRYTGTPPELEDTGVSLSTSVGTLVLITISGDIEESVEIVEFAATDMDDDEGNLFESAPLKLMQRLRNNGNVHVQPTGQVKIRDMFNRDVAAANVNLSRNNILPDSVRRFEQDIDSSLIGDKRLFGHYTAELELEYGDGETVTDTLTFWVIPYRLIGVIIVLLLLAVFGVRFMLKRYKKRILSQAQGSRRPAAKR